MQTVTPASVDELAAALRETTGAVAVHGSRTRQRWGAPGVAADVVVDVSAMNRVVEHAAGDLVVTVEAGALLSDLREVVGEQRQWLAIDPPAGGTIGGILATADSGPRRLRFGTPRDLLLGVTVVLADGTVARSGGKVVKNVAGYDLGKLFTGSFGTLGVIAQATLRLHPSFVARRVVTVGCEDPWPAVRAVLRSAATPTAIEWYDDQLHVVIESSEAAVDPQAAEVAALVGGAVATQLPAAFVSRPTRGGDILVKLTFRIAALGEVLADVRAAAPGAMVRAHAGSGVLWASTRPDRDLLERLRAVVAAYDGTAVVVDGPEDFRRTVDVWGPVRGLDVMRRIKAQFDPDARMSPGRFVGGL